MTLYLFFKGFTENRTMVWSTFDNTTTIVIKDFKDGMLTIQQITSKSELHPRDIIKIVIDCFDDHSTFANVRGIQFEINKVLFRCTKQNIDADLMLRHYWKNNGTKSPEIYS